MQHATGIIYFAASAFSRNAENVVVIRDERGKEIGRHVAGVRAVFPGESRSFEVSVEAVPADGKRRLRH